MVWLCLILVVGISSIVIFGLSFFNISEEEMGLQGIIFSLSLFFTFMYAYYGGALTMFLMTENDISFSNLEKAIRTFPEQKIIFR